MGSKRSSKDGETPEPVPRSRTRRIARVLWRILRTSIVLCVLFLALAVLYLNQVGLPERVRQRLTAGLREKGWEVQYSQLRLSLSRPGIIAENLYLHRTNLWSGPQIYVQKAQCRLRRGAFRKQIGRAHV